MGTPADVAEACLYLSSDAASYVTGANLPTLSQGAGIRTPVLAAAWTERAVPVFAPSTLSIFAPA
jgi:NAD(P)-dependent dehydrogenase (short-subunit alcohol dehydrogenase family)